MDLERRATRQPLQATEGRRLAGYAATYDTPTIITDITGRQFREVIRPHAFRASLEQGADVVALYNHNPDLGVLARTKSGTLRLTEDERGLRFDLELPETPLAQALVASIGRGDLDSCSFAFLAKRDEWRQEEGLPLRELLDLDLHDISIVTFPAYDSTSVDVRSACRACRRSQWRRRLQLLRAEM